MNRLIVLAILSACLGSTAGAQETPVYDAIERAYTPYMDSSDAMGFPMKLRSLRDDPYTFWRGTKDLFFAWCAIHAADWRADRAAYLPNHGDLHLGNIGSYAAADGPFGTLAFGMVDFDDSAELPFQVELLQGAITLRLIAQQNGIQMTSPQRAALMAELFEAYRSAVGSGQSATQRLADDPAVRKLLARGGSHPYSREVEKYVVDDRFRTVIASGKGTVKEILRPVEGREAAFAQAIVAGLANAPESARRFRFRDVESVQRSIRSIALRTRLGSSGSQGLKKYFVLLERPLAEVEGDVILYLKQQIPAAAQRSGFAQPDPREPGRRCAEHMLQMTDPSPAISSWCTLGDESYWLTVKEPWSDELDHVDVRDFSRLLHAARTWAIVAGTAHGRDSQARPVILSRLDETLLTTIDQRATEYLQQLHADHTAFRADPRTTRAVEAAERAIER